MVVADGGGQFFQALPEGAGVEDIADPNDRRTPAAGELGDHVEHGGQFAHELRRPVAVRLVDHEDIGDLHDPGLDRLDLVAHPRDEDDDDRMGVVDDLHLLLPGSHGLHHDDFFSHDVHDMDGVADGPGEAAQGAAGGEAADEDAGVFGMALHPDPVA